MELCFCVRCTWLACAVCINYLWIKIVVIHLKLVQNTSLVGTVKRASSNILLLKQRLLIEFYSIVVPISVNQLTPICGSSWQALLRSWGSEGPTRSRRTTHTSLHTRQGHCIPVWEFVLARKRNGRLWTIDLISVICTFQNVPGNVLLCPSTLGQQVQWFKESKLNTSSLIWSDNLPYVVNMKYI